MPALGGLVVLRGRGLRIVRTIETAGVLGEVENEVCGSARAEVACLGDQVSGR